MTAIHPPLRIETERLVLRCWSESDAPLMREALDSSIEHLRPWLPWAMAEPKTLEQTQSQLARFEAAFRAGEDFVYGIFEADESRVIGGTGLHPRVGPGALEIGYWIRVDETHRGFATEIARALTTAGLELPDIDRIEIHCDPDNVHSRRIPVRLGYRLVEVRRGDKTGSDGQPRDTMVFHVTGSEWRAAETS